MPTTAVIRTPPPATMAAADPAPFEDGERSHSHVLDSLAAPDGASARQQRGPKTHRSGRREAVVFAFLWWDREREKDE